MKTCNFFSNWDSLHATPYSHYKARLKYTGNLFRKCPKLKGVLIFDLKHRSKESILWAENSRAWLCEERLCVDIGILVTSKNDDKKTMQSIRLTSRPYSRMRKWNKLSEFRWTSTKIKSIEKIQRLVKGWREAASEGPTVLLIRLYSLSNNSKKQLRAPSLTWHQCSLQGRMVDL